MPVKRKVGSVKYHMLPFQMVPCHLQVLMPSDSDESGYEPRAKQMPKIPV